MVIIIKKIGHPLYFTIIPEKLGNNTQDRPTNELNKAYKIVLCFPSDIPLIKEIYAVVDIPPMNAAPAVTHDKYTMFLLTIDRIKNSRYPKIFKAIKLIKLFLIPILLIMGPLINPPIITMIKPMIFEELTISSGVYSLNSKKGFSIVIAILFGI